MTEKHEQPGSAEPERLLPGSQMWVRVPGVIGWPLLGAGG